MATVLRRLRGQPVAVAAFLEAVVALLLALGVVDAALGAGLTGAIAAGLALVQRVVTPVEKVSKVLERPLGEVNDLLKKVKL